MRHMQYTKSGHAHRLAFATTKKTPLLVSCRVCVFGHILEIFVSGLTEHEIIFSFLAGPLLPSFRCSNYESVVGSSPLNSNAAHSTEKIALKRATIVVEEQLSHVHLRREADKPFRICGWSAHPRRTRKPAITQGNNSMLIFDIDSPRGPN